MEPRPRIVVLGRIGAPFAIRGWLKVKSYTEPGENLLSYRTWLVGRHAGAGHADDAVPGREQWQPVTLEGGRVAHGSGADLLVKLTGIETPEAARLLTGCDVGVERSALPPLEAGEYYWDDLLHFEAYSPEGQLLGRLEHFSQTAAHGLLVIRAADGKALLVPMVRERILQVDRPAGRITVDWQLDWS